MRSVRTIPTAVLLHFDSLTIVDSVLGRDVIATLAVFACKSNLDTLFVLCHSSIPK